VEAARLAANQTARPWGVSGSTPEDVWDTRQAIHAQDRNTFGRVVQQFQDTARQEQGYAPNCELDRTAQASLNRVAIRKALMDQNLLGIAR
jgi:hypothetical protein